jgi:glycosyltransferase involved in cell wall biosynthesis
MVSNEHCKSKIKILHIIGNLGTGGAEMALHNLLSGLNRERFEPTVLSLMSRGAILGDQIEALETPVHVLGMARGKPSLQAFGRLVKIVRSLQPDIIQGWDYHGNLAATLAGIFASKPAPVLWNIRHTPYNLKVEKRMTSWIIRLGAYLSHIPVRIIYVAQISAIYHEALGYPETRRKIIPNGFDLVRFTPSTETRTSVRSELGLCQDAILIGLIGNFRPEKDHENFLKAAKITIQKWSNVHFLLVGYGVNNSNELLTKLIANNGLSAQIHLLDERHDVPRLTAALDIATSSSWSEAFPNIIGEAMSCGVPCVVTDVGDSAWIVGQTGLVVPPRDPEALAEAWDKILSLDIAERRRLGTQARQRVEECFSLARMIQAYEQIHTEVAREKAR